MSKFYICLGCGHETKDEDMVTADLCHTCYEEQSYGVCRSCGNAIPAGDIYCLYCERMEADI